MLSTTEVPGTLPSVVGVKRKPLMNLDEIPAESFIEESDHLFQQRYAVVSDDIGAVKLGYNVTIVPIGGKACPFHNHRVGEEMFIVLSGTGVLRFGEDRFDLKPMDVIACPPGDASVAHQIINTSQTQELRYLAIGTNEAAEVVEYPDSSKIMCSVKKNANSQSGVRHMARKSDAVDYNDGEK